MPRPRRITRDALIASAIGLGLALIALAVPVIGSVPDVLLTVIHELGHTATAWFFGSPALPSFDLTYGGGFSLTYTRQPILIGLVYLGLLVLLLRWGRDPARRALIVGAALAYTVVAFTALRELAILAMGHGMELIIAAIFLSRALDGGALLRPEERPLYAALGTYIVLHDARFALRLLLSAAHQRDYAEAKGGGHAMDFSRIADEFLGGRLQPVVAVFLLLCLLTPLASFLLYHYRVPRRRPRRAASRA